MNDAYLPEPDFIACQRGFAAHIRHPGLLPPPADVDARRMAIYAELFFNNVESFLADGFPVIRRITPDERWLGMVRDFYASHSCVTPLFSRLTEEFLHYLKYERAAEAADPPFLAELAHYEWVELALVYSDADAQAQAVDPNGDLLNGCPSLSPLAWPLTYRYPVHRIGPDCQPSEAPRETVHLLVYRDRQERVGFLEINDLTHALLEALRSPARVTGREALEAIAEVIKHPRPELAIRNGERLLQDLRRKGILTGTREEPAKC